MGQSTKAFEAACAGDEYGSRGWDGGRKKTPGTGNHWEVLLELLIIQERGEKGWKEDQGS